MSSYNIIGTALHSAKAGESVSIRLIVNPYVGVDIAQNPKKLEHNKEVNVMAKQTKEKNLNIAGKIEILKKQLSRERTRVNRIVQVLQNNLSEKQLDKDISFHGTDCSGNYRLWPHDCGYTLRDLLRETIDP